jgi:hypothetical protein
MPGAAWSTGACRSRRPGCVVSAVADAPGRGSRVSIVVVDPADPYRYVEIRGVVLLVDDPKGELIDELSVKYTGEPWVEPHPDVERVIVRITPQKVYVR